MVGISPEQSSKTDGTAAHSLWSMQALLLEVLGVGEEHYGVRRDEPISRVAFRASGAACGDGGERLEQ